MSAPQATVVCVAEDNADYFQRVLTLAVSLRNLGGSLASAPVHAYFVDSLDGIRRHPLASLGVTTSIVERYPCSQPQANKLRMFEKPEVDPDGVLVALDCDVAILGDISTALSTSAIRATVGYLPPMTSDEWVALLGQLDLRADQRWVLWQTGEEVPAPYLNSGVLFVPARMIAPLYESWAFYLSALDPVGGQVTLPTSARPYLDQVALACALLGTGLPVEPLGLEYNFPTRPPELAGRSNFDTPLIAHYHRWVDADGILLPPTYAPLEPPIKRLNALVAGRKNLPEQGTPGRPAQAVASAKRLARSLRSS